jgi:hypothetical protein
MAIRKLDKTEAYKESYGVKDKRAAGKRGYDLYQKPHIQERIAFLSEYDIKQEVSKIDADRTWVERELLCQYHEATQANDRSNAIKILQLIGTDVGMFVKRSEVLTGKLELEEDPDVLRQRIVARIQKLFPGADPDAFMRTALAGGARPGAELASGSREADREVPVQPIEVVRSVPEAARVPRPGSDEEEALSHGSEPGREDVLSVDGDGVPSNG